MRLRRHVAKKSECINFLDWCIMKQKLERISIENIRICLNQMHIYVFTLVHTLQMCPRHTNLCTVGAKKVLYSTVLLPYLTVLYHIITVHTYDFFVRTSAYPNCTFTAPANILTAQPPYFPRTVHNHKRLVGVFAYFYGTENNAA